MSDSGLNRARGARGGHVAVAELEAVRSGMSLAQALRAIPAAMWSGQIEIATEEHPDAGTAVFWQGRLGWATSRSQGLTLGAFMRRLGQVSADELDIVVAQFEANGGKTKLGRLMEEAGILTRRTLRRCLRLHLRLAVGSLLARDASVAVVQTGPNCEEENILFEIQELLPEWTDGGEGAGDSLPTGPRDATTTVLESLKRVPGHACSLVCDRSGAIIASRGVNEGQLPGPSVLATSGVTLLETALHTAAWTQLGSADFASAEGTEGALLAHWLDADRRFLAVILMRPDGKVGIARHELAGAAAVIGASLK